MLPDSLSGIEATDCAFVKNCFALLLPISKIDPSLIDCFASDILVQILVVEWYAKMTIFVNKNADKKEDSDSAPPEVVNEVKVCGRSC